MEGKTNLPKRTWNLLRIVKFMGGASSMSVRGGGPCDVDGLLSRITSIQGLLHALQRDMEDAVEIIARPAPERDNDAARLCLSKFMERVFGDIVPATDAVYDTIRRCSPETLTSGLMCRFLAMMANSIRVIDNLQQLRAAFRTSGDALVLVMHEHLTDLRVSVHDIFQLAKRVQASLPLAVHTDIAVLAVPQLDIRSKTDIVRNLPPVLQAQVFSYFRFQPRSREELQAAVWHWCNGRAVTLAKYGDIQEWDVSRITDMHDLFADQSTFNDDISAWDVSRVTDMSGMFDGAKAFNRPLGSWDVSRVTNMSAMFRDAAAFNQPLSNWDVRNVRVMDDMFEGAKAFNQALNDWNVSRVQSMDRMFAGAEAFSQPLDRWVAAVTREPAASQFQDWRRAVDPTVARQRRRVAGGTQQQPTDQATETSHNPTRYCLERNPPICFDENGMFIG